MAHIVKDRVAETTTTTGTGALTLAGAIVGFRAFSSVCTTGDTAYYMIEGIDSSGVPTGEWETGIGTYSGANTLTRTTVTASSNSGSVVTLSAGTKRVTIARIAAQTPDGVGVFTVATAGDTFIAVPLDADDGKTYHVVVRGTPSADASFAFRVSDDNAATVKSGASDYKAGTTSSTSTVALSGSVGSGREFHTNFTLSGMNGGASTRIFTLVGVHYTINAAGTPSVGTVSGYANALAAGNYNGFHIYCSAGNMNDMEVVVTRLR